MELRIALKKKFNYVDSARVEFMRFLEKMSCSSHHPAPQGQFKYYIRSKKERVKLGAYTQYTECEAAAAPGFPAWGAK